mgnify:FL=1
MRTLAILAFSFAVGTLTAALEPKGGWWLPAAAVLLALTNWVKPTKNLHPIVFIAASAVVGVVFRFAGV